MTDAQANFIINRISGMIDFELTHIYGTVRPLFGTNSWGTSDIPLELNDICINLSMAKMYQNTWHSITASQRDWALEVYGYGTSLLGKVVDDYAFLYPYNGTLETDNTMVIAGEYGTVLGEPITITGTNLTALTYRKIVKAITPVIYGTTSYPGTALNEGTHYKILYYGDTRQGQNYGNVQGLIEGTTFNMLIDYNYYIPRNFILKDSFHWGESQAERR
jgi:hypothetical protein